MLTFVWVLCLGVKKYATFDFTMSWHHHSSSFREFNFERSCCCFIFWNHFNILSKVISFGTAKKKTNVSFLSTSLMFYFSRLDFDFGPLILPNSHHSQPYSCESNLSNVKLVTWHYPQLPTKQSSFLILRTKKVLLEPMVRFLVGRNGELPCVFFFWRYWWKSKILGMFVEWLLYHEILLANQFDQLLLLYLEKKLWIRVKDLIDMKCINELNPIHLYLFFFKLRDWCRSRFLFLYLFVRSVESV